ncbi:MAG: DUF4124 domain-containing protein [Xanthomonadales bacterium]|nr:DUF4124 domain-containing protein [Xanthomonadales bacterium]
MNRASLLLKVSALCVALLFTAVTTAPDAAAQKASGSKKLYRWVDKDGNVHYSDSVPPEAVDQARDEINQAGRTVKSVDRALTDDEIATAEAAKAAAEVERKRMEEQEKMDAILLTSYSSEDALKRAYQERFDLMDQSIESARVGLKSQEKSLAELLAHAAEQEQQNKPVSATVKASLELARKQTEQQRGFLTKREQDKIDLAKEYDETLNRYRELARAKAEAQR